MPEQLMSEGVMLGVSDGRGVFDGVKVSVGGMEGAGVPPLAISVNT